MTELPQLITDIVGRTGRQPHHLVAWLHAIQESIGYVPQEALEMLARETEATLGTITDVVTFHPRFRLKPCGKYRVRVCIGTACHVKGAESLFDAFCKHLKLAEGQDTDADKLFTVEKVACLGCCSIAPAVQIGKILYGPVSNAGVAEVLRDFLASEAIPAVAMDDAHRGGGNGFLEVRLCTCTSCAAVGAAKVADAFRSEAKRLGIRADVKETSCLGVSFDAPFVDVATQSRVFRYARVKVHHVEEILVRHSRSAFQKLSQPVRELLERLPKSKGDADAPVRYSLEEISAGAFDCDRMQSNAIECSRTPQIRLATESAGELSPLDFEGYKARGGFAALEAVASGRMTPEEVVGVLRESRLRGRGGAGFPTWAKWAATVNIQHPTSNVQRPTSDRYVVCNGDEGDPGAFMDRMILESFPFRVIEGMLVAMRVIGARQGFLYIREEYPLAIRRVREAIAVCREKGILKNSESRIQDAECSLEVIEGAGSFVCGEETALLASIEGRRAMPSPRPLFPSERGLWGCPTLVNNVETFSLVPWILRHGAEAFCALGTERSPGTKVFALAGNIRRGGLIEVPMGMSLRQIVEDIGGGVQDGKPFKAVLVGGPSGGCIPYWEADVKVDYEALVSVGAMMGSGGFVVLGERDCVVDVVRYFLRFTQDESCGRCVPCRAGTKNILQMLDALAEGKGTPAMLEELERMSLYVKSGSLCGLGKSAPNPVISALRHFWDEFEAHVAGRCPAGRCKALSKRVVSDRCIGCTKCAQICTADAVRSVAYRRHEIDRGKCTLCDACIPTCPRQAIEARPMD